MKENNKKSKIDFTALAIFIPSLIALAIVPVLMQATMVLSDSKKMLMLFGGSESEVEGVYEYIDIYSQIKASAVAFFAIVMLVMSLLCCIYLFKKSEKRRLVYVGASLVYVVMTLISAINSKYSDIAFNGVFNRAEGFFTLACYFVIFLFTIYAFKRTQNFYFVVLALMICTGLNFVIGLFQFFGDNLYNYEWFQALAIDPDYADTLTINSSITTEKSKMYGALFHYNYMGSFTGMIFPIFVVLTLAFKKISHKIIAGIFAVITLFMLLTSEARSGVVAVAVAALIGVVVFGRVLIRHWKKTVSVIAAAAILLVGANFATGNKLFARIPSLFSDAISLITPAEKTDLFDTLPVRKITHNKNGSVSFTTQTNVLTMSFDADKKQYVFTDIGQNIIEPQFDENKIASFPENDFGGINIGFIRSSDELEYDDIAFLQFYGKSNSSLLFYLFGDNEIHLIDPRTAQKVSAVNAESIGFEGKEKIGSARGYIWSRTIPLLDKCLVTGYGPDTYAFVFPQNDYLAKYYSYDEGFNVIVDKPHNMYLQIFMSSGLIALIAFLWICGFYIVDCIRLYALKKNYRAEQYFGISIMLAVIGYLAAGFFNDSVVSVAPVFWILLGTGVALNTINRRHQKEDSAPLVTEAQEKTVDTAEQFRKDQEADERRAMILGMMSGENHTAYKEDNTVKPVKSQPSAEERARNMEIVKRLAEEYRRTHAEEIKQAQQERTEEPDEGATSDTHSDEK